MITSNHIFEICFLQNTAEMFDRHPFLIATDPDQEKRRKYLGEYSCISVIRDRNNFTPIFAMNAILYMKGRLVAILLSVV